MHKRPCAPIIDKLETVVGWDSIVGVLLPEGPEGENVEGRKTAVEPGQRLSWTSSTTAV